LKNPAPLLHCWFNPLTVDGMQTAGLSMVNKVLLMHCIPGNEGVGNAVMLHAWATFEHLATAMLV